MSEFLQVAHVELLTPVLDESVRFFRDLLGMYVSLETVGSCYLRAYEDRYHHSLKLTESPTTGLGHVGLRVQSDDRLHQAASDFGDCGEWTDGDAGHGRSFQVSAPSGHVFELFHEVEYFQAPPELRSRVLNRAQRRPLHGIPVRRIDHVNLMATDVGALSSWLTDALKFELRELAVRPNGEQLGVWLSSNSLMHTIAAGLDSSGVPGRLHHVGFWYGAPQHLWDIAEHLVEHGIGIEHGPGKHGITQSMYLYVFEPGGNRIELFGDVGQLVFDPTWEPIIWVDDGSPTTRSTWIGNPPPPGFFTHGTPRATAEAPVVVPESDGWLR